MLGKTNVRKWKVFGIRKEQYIDHYEEEQYQTGTESYIDHYDSVIDHYETKAVAVGSGGAHFNGININAFRVEGTGGQSGDWYTGSVTLSWSETRPYQGTVYRSGTYSIGTEITGQASNYRITSTNVTIWRNQQVPIYRQEPVYGTRPTYGTRQVPVYAERDIITETWHPWWVRNKG